MKPSIPTPKFIRQREEKAKKAANRGFRPKPASWPASSSASFNEKAAHTPDQAAPGIELYQREDDPFSHAVRNRLSALGLDFVAHAVPMQNPLKHKMLLHAGGRDQIPFLIDHRTGTKLYGSGAIVSYLDKEYSQNKQLEGSPSPVLRVARAIDQQIRGQADRLAWAVRRPIERAVVLRHELRASVNTLRGSFVAVKEAFENSAGLKASRVGRSRPPSQASSRRRRQAA